MIDTGITLDSITVTTSFSCGTIVTLDRESTKSFLLNAAINVIALSRSRYIELSTDRAVTKTNLRYYDELITDYCAGDYELMLNNMLVQNAIILYQFVKDCVINRNSRDGDAYLLREKTKNGKPAWRLILNALEDFQKISSTISAKAIDTYLMFGSRPHTCKLINYTKTPFIRFMNTTGALGSPNGITKNS